MGKSNCGNNKMQHTNCIDCGVGLVSGRVPKNMIPEGFKPHKAHGRCASCDSTYRWNQRSNPSDMAKPPQDVEHDRANLEAFLRRIKGKSYV